MTWSADRDLNSERIIANSALTIAIMGERTLRESRPQSDRAPNRIFGNDSRKPLRSHWTTVAGLTSTMAFRACGQTGIAKLRGAGLWRIAEADLGAAVAGQSLDVAAMSSSSREARRRTRKESRETTAERIEIIPTTVWRWRKNL